MVWSYSRMNPLVAVLPARGLGAALGFCCANSVRFVQLDCTASATRLHGRARYAPRVEVPSMECSGGPVVTGSPNLPTRRY